MVLLLEAVIAIAALVCLRYAFEYREGITAKIDNVLRIGIARDIKVVKRAPRGTISIGQFLGNEAKWSGRHADEAWRTLVECAVEKDGVIATYYWEVDRGFSPRLNYRAASGVHITPLTRATAELSVMQLDERQLAELPDRPGLGAAALHQAAERPWSD